MTKDFSQAPIEGEEAAKFRKMHHEWGTFKETHLDPLSKVSWVVKNWKLLGLIFIIGAAGSLKNVLETMRAWL